MKRSCRQSLVSTVLVNVEKLGFESQHLPTQAERQFALHAAAVGRIHPEQELPAAGEGDGQGVEDLPGVDAGGRQT